MTAALTIGGTSVTFIEDTMDITYNLDERQRLQCDLIDYTGSLHFVKGEQVLLTDPVVGTMFNGYLNTDQEYPIYPTGAIRHTIDCIDQHYLADKRTYTRTYNTAQPAGKLVADQLHDVLSQEGVATNYALHFDTTNTDFNQGILSGTVGLVSTGDGDLELAKAGSDLTITENTTAAFAAGTLTNVQATSNTLQPITVSGLKVTTVLPFTQVAANITINIWSGSKPLGTNDTLNCSIFIASTSPQSMATVGMTFSDGSQTTGITDQNGLAIDASTDLSSNAQDQWYTRTISTSAYNGKTVSKVWVAFGGTTLGSYTAYVKNIYLSSSPGSPFFSTTATAPQLNPVVVASSSGYASTSVVATVVPVIDPTGSSRISPAYSIDSVKLLRSSLIAWSASGATIAASYDGGATYQPCTNNAPLPAFPAGSNVAGLSVTLKESFFIGSNPTIIPALQSVNVTLISAPNATKSDVVKSFATQSDWNTGTLTGAQALSNGDLTTGAINQGWSYSQLINQTFFPDSGITQSVSSGTYSLIIPVDGSTNKGAMARLDWAGTLSNFTFDFDVSVPNTFNFSSQAIIQYLQTRWTNGVHGGQGAYMLALQQSGISQNIGIYRGTNSSTDSLTTIQVITRETPSHVRISVQSGGHHTIYFDRDPNPVFSFTDTTFTSGQIGVGGFTFFQNPNGGGPGNFTYSNPVVTPSPTQQWLSPSTSISALGTCGNSVITWTEANTGQNAAVSVQSSIDGGTTWQTCTNGGPIPNLPSGTNVSGKSVKLSINFYANPSVFLLPILRQLAWRVLGQYPGSSGTRSTIPLGNDPFSRANVASGWGTAFDSQTWTQAGTGTTSVSSNEGLISNTTGDVHMVLGSRTWTDEDGTVRFQLSASTITGGMELRYVDANNFYRLAATTTTLSIIQKRTSTTTLASTPVSLSTGVFYWLRFRAVGNGPVNLYGKVWAFGALEPITWNLTASV